MGATSTPALLQVRGGAEGWVRQLGTPSGLRSVWTFTMSNSYATGGDTLTLPTSDVKGKELLGVNVLTPTPDVTADRYLAWNGSVSAPKITARVISTAAQVANATDLSAVTVTVELIYGS